VLSKRPGTLVAALFGPLQPGEILAAFLALFSVLFFLPRTSADVSVVVAVF